MIRIENLNKFFNRNRKNELHVLNDINLELPSTGLICILGESGSGKTTLLNTLGGLDVFQGGSITIEDTKLKKYEPSKIEKLRSEKFGYVFQNYYLLQDYSVVYNVKLALNKYDLTEEEKDERVTYVLEQLGIARYKKKLVSKLSGGQQQRVSIARALVKSPQIILADEPTGNLDEENTIRIMSILRNISKECLVILVSHEKRIANFFADRIIEIRDGEIIGDRENSADETYSRADDGNIYLPELKEISLEGDNTEIQVYHNADGNSDDTGETIRLKLAWKDGKLYIRNDMECDVVFAGEESGCEMIDGERPELDLQEVEKFSYHLEGLRAKKSAALPMREIWRMAKENLYLLGKKQAFVICIMLAAAVLLTLSIADYTTTAFIHKEDVVQDDSHYVAVEMVPTSNFYRDDIKERQESFIDNVIVGNNLIDQTFIDVDRDASFRYSDFFQMRGLDIQITDFSYVDISHVKGEDILYGRMPEQEGEIVVDALVLNRILKSGTLMADRIYSIEKFLNYTLLMNAYEKEFTIVGITDNEEPSIYCYQDALIGMTVTGTQVAGFAQLQAAYPDEFGAAELKEGEVLVSETQIRLIKMSKKYRNKKGELVVKFAKDSLGDYYVPDEDDKKSKAKEVQEYRVVGTFPGQFDARYVIANRGTSDIVRKIAINSRKCKVYVENPEDREKVAALISEGAKEYNSFFKVKVTIPYEEQIEEYKAARQGNVDSKKIFVMLVLVVALLMIYFTIKSNVLARMEELTVYRLIGIGKASIMKAYLLEMLLINTYTSLPAVLITTLVIHIFASVPSLNISLTFPLWGMGTLLAAIYVVTGIISMLPVHNILSKPPAELAIKQ
ncbi:MAG: ABC transporter ATP-binding protein/permease [Lachnospiraceae bacterium]|nr:ABC transporter ATP-binding protein/permease [Lachnospiraceae bacterium]